MSLNVFLQCQNQSNVIHLALAEDVTVASLKATLIERRLADAETELYLEDADEPLETTTRLDSFGRSNIKVHASGCKRVEVTVTFGGRSIEHKFAPSTTVAKVQRWASERFELTPEDASDHILQLSGTHDRPSPTVHIGSLARDCRVAFDLLPNERIQG